MKTPNQLMRIALFLAMLLILSQKGISQMSEVKKGVVRIKVEEQTARYLQSAKFTLSPTEYLKTGNATLDRVLYACKASKMKRVFRHGGKFEAKHRKYGLHLWYEVQFDHSTNVTMAVSEFDQLREVQKSEPVYQKNIIGYDRMMAGTRVVSLNAAPDDPQYENQWHYNNTGQTGGTSGADISLPQAWNIQTGDNQVIVAVTDGGIDVDHEDLAANMWVNGGETPGNGIDDDNNGYIDDINGYNFVDATGTITAHSHGTHVGGTVAAVTNNGIGVAGVAGGDGTGDGIRLMSCASFTETSSGGFEETYIYAADNGANISQNSWGYINPGVFEQVVLDAIDYFIAEAGFDENDNPVGPMQGGIVIFAAGNDGSFDDYYPGFYDPVLAVGGTDHNDDEYTSSNRGDWVDVAAPAVNVLSTLPNNLYGTNSGTSMACPHVSGLAGLILSNNIGSITPDQIRARIEQTTDPLPGLEFLGTGRINAFSALQQDDGIAPDDITDLAIQDITLSSVTLQWTAPADEGNGSATFYDIRYSTSAITADNFDAATVIANPPGASLAGTTESFEVTGLDPGTSYYFAIKSKDFFDNISGISNAVSATTEEAPEAGVSPESLTAYLTSGQTETQVLTITNDGEGPLEFDISFGGTTFTPLTSSGSKVIKPHSKLFYSTESFNRTNSVETLSGSQYNTGFESYNLGDLNDQNDWFASFEDWSVSNTMPFEGSNHVLGISEELPVGQTRSLAISPTVEAGVEDYTSTAVKIKIIGDGVTWQYIPQSPTAGSVVTRISFDADGGLSILDNNVGDYVSISHPVPTDYFDLKLVVHKSTMDMNLYIDNELIYTGRAYTSEIEQVVLFSTMELEGREFYADNIEIYDGIIDTYPFLSTNITSGTVEGGEEQQIEVNFDANKLFGGTYENEIQINTNDPVNPDFIVPAVMVVKGTNKPIIAVDKNPVIFDDIFVGASVEGVIEISNNGTEELIVSNIKSDSPEFEVVSETSFTVMPFESQLVTLQFSPSVIGENSGEISIVSNDPDNPQLSVNLQGSGIDAPVINVDPTSISAELFSGASTTDILTITNTGAADLEFSIEIGSEKPALSSISTDIPAKTGKAVSTSQATKQRSSGSFSGMKVFSEVSLSAENISVLLLTPDDDISDVETTLAAFPDLTVTRFAKAALPGITITDVEGFDVIMTTNNTKWLDEGAVDPAVIGDLLADYIDQGGKVIANSFAYDFAGWGMAGRFITENYGPFSGTTTDFNDDTDMGTVHEPDHPVMAGVTAISNTYLLQNPTLTPEATLLADWSDGNHFVAVNNNVVALNILPSDGSGAPGWTGDLATLYHNAILWLSDSGVGSSGFVSVDLTEGILSNGESAQVEVTLNAKGLDAGSYLNNININSNDPVNNLTQVPVSLEVLGPPISANPEELTEELEKEQTSTQILTLTNNTSEEVSFDIAIEGSDGTVDTKDNYVVRKLTQPLVKRTTPFSGIPIEPNSFKAISSNSKTGLLSTEQYATGFESFAIGDINEQEGWFAEFSNWVINTTNPHEGNQHLRSVSDGLGQTRAFSPEVPIGNELISTASAQLNIQGSGVTWEFVPQSNTAGFIITRLRFKADGTAEALVSDGAGGAVLEPLSAAIPSGYFKVDVEAERATSEFTVFFDGKEVFSGLGFAGDIEQLVIISAMEITGPILDVDDIQIIDGKADAGLSFISANPLSGIIGAGASVDIEVTFDATDQEFGTYHSNIVATINDGAMDPVIVPATLKVFGDPAISIDPTVVQETVDFNKTSTRTINIENTGGNPLDFDLTVIGAEAKTEVSEMSELLSRATTKKAKPFNDRIAAKMQKDNLLSTNLVPDQPKSLYLTIGDPIFTEDFEGSTFPPEGWSVIDNEGTGVEWKLAADYDMGNYCGSGEAASVNSDFFGTAEFDTELITPPINIAGKSNLSIKYNVNYQNFAGSDFLDLDISTDNGNTWTTILSWNEDHGTSDSAPGETVNISLDEFTAGADEMMIRWHYYDPNTGDYDWYAQIDDLEIIENTIVWLAIDQSSGTVPVGETAEIELQFDATVVNPGTYVAGIIANSNASNTPVVGIVASMQELNPGEISVNPASLAQELVAGRKATQTLTINNSGESTLDFQFKDNFPNIGVASSTTSLTSESASGNISEGPYDLLSTEAMKSPRGGKVTTAIEPPVEFSDVLYATNFESFDVGDIDDQQGWGGQFGSWEIDSSNPYGRSQHIRGTSNGFLQAGAFSPEVAVGTDGISSTSMMVDIEGSGVTWQIIPQSPSAGFVVTRLSFDADGTASALVSDNDGEYQPISADIPEGHFKVTITVERETNVFSVYFDDVEVFSGNGSAGSIEQVVLLGLMEETGSTFDVDNLQIVDGIIPELMLSASPSVGSIPSGESQEVEIQFNAINLLGGIYEEDLVILSNDPENSEVIIPTTLTVIDPQIISVKPDSLKETLPQGNMSTQVLTIANDGVADLIFKIDINDEVPTAGNSSSFKKDRENNERILEKMALDIDEGPVEDNINTSVTFHSLAALVSEDFEGGTFPPEGWSVIDNEGTGVEWKFAADYNEGNYAGSGEAATVSSDDFGAAEFDTELWTPSINVDGKTGLVLQYVVNYQNFAGQDFLDVDISTDGGSNWTTMLSWNEDHGTLHDLPGESVSIDLDSYLEGADSFIIRWHYYDPTTGEFDWYAQIDDVVIGIPWLSVSNTNGTIPGSSSMDIEVKFDASLLDPGDFNTNLIVCSNDLKNPQVVVPALLHVLKPATITLSPDTIKASVFEGFDKQAYFEIGNNGEASLIYDVITQPAFVTDLDPDQGTITPGNATEVSLTLNTDGLTPGKYVESIDISSNDPNNPTTSVVVELTVLELVVLDMEVEAVCSDNPDAERGWKVTNPNEFAWDAYWFIIGSSEGGDITLEPGENYIYSTTLNDRPNTFKLKWLNEDGTPQDIVENSITTPCDIIDLDLVSVCSNNPDLFRRWQIDNPNVFTVQVNWEVSNTDQTGMLYIPGNGSIFFYTETIDGTNTASIKWLDENGDEQQATQDSSGEICDIDNSCNGDEIVAFNQARRKNGKAISKRRSNPSKATGLPQENNSYNFVSLGFGGDITIKLNSLVADQPGNDFIVVETSYYDTNRPCEVYPETADVYVSLDGAEFYLVGSACKDTEFDISSTGLMEIQYVKIVDTSNPSKFLSGYADGFDVDGIVCINAHYSKAQPVVMSAIENKVADEDSDEFVSAYPNPFTKLLSVSMDVEEDGEYGVKVYDITGTMVHSSKVKSEEKTIMTSIDTRSLAEGTYTVVVLAKDRSIMKSRVLVKK